VSRRSRPRLAGDAAETKSYFAALKDCGYPLSPVEELVNGSDTNGSRADGAEAGSADDGSEPAADQEVDQEGEQRGGSDAADHGRARRDDPTEIPDSSPAGPGERRTPSSVDLT
jgi:hypothetical protein